MKIQKIYVQVNGAEKKAVRDHLINGGYPETLCLLNREAKTR